MKFWKIIGNEEIVGVSGPCAIAANSAKTEVPAKSAKRCFWSFESLVGTGNVGRLSEAGLFPLIPQNDNF